MEKQELNGRLYEEREFFRECTGMNYKEAIQVIDGLHRFFSEWPNHKYANRKLYSLRRLCGAETWLALRNETHKPVFVDKDSLTQCIYIPEQCTRYAVSAMNFITIKENTSKDRIILTVQ